MLLARPQRTQFVLQPVVLPLLFARTLSPPCCSNVRGNSGLGGKSGVQWNMLPNVQEEEALDYHKLRDFGMFYGDPSKTYSIPEPAVAPGTSRNAHHRWCRCPGSAPVAVAAVTSTCAARAWHCMSHTPLVSLLPPTPTVPSRPYRGRARCAQG